MARPTTNPVLFDEVNRISISDLRKHDLLQGKKLGIIRWSRGDYEAGRIRFLVNAETVYPYVNLEYSIGGEEMSYRVPLVRVESNLGKGTVWYFRCPFTQRICRILYLTGKVFTHRSAVKGLYTSQTYSKKCRELKRLFDFVVDSRSENDETESVSRQYYNGKPTRKFSQLIKRRQRREASIDRITFERITSGLW